ncbi:MAG: hypothetical protein KDD73_11840 [Anaerolineales bacterium]|nr:hypothetical protein [Anaerolineales bacterium]
MAWQRCPALRCAVNAGAGRRAGPRWGARLLALSEVEGPRFVRVIGNTQDVVII